MLNYMLNLSLNNIYIFFQQIRYPINQQRIQRGANNRYRVSGPGMLTNRFVNTKQKKTKAKKEKKTSKSEENDENDENKTTPKEEEEEPTTTSENGYVNWIK